MVSPVALSILLAISPAAAQRTPEGKFDLTKPLSVKGTVTQVEWANPCVRILVRVLGKSRPVLWAVEVESASLLAKNGWSQTSLQIGETVTVQGFRFRDGSNQMSGNSVSIAGTGRRVYFGHNGARTEEAAYASTPRRSNPCQGSQP